MNVHPSPAQMSTAADLVRRFSATGHRFDPESFWAANDVALRDPFGPRCPQLPLGITMSDEVACDELGIAPSWHRLFHDDEYHAEICARYNDRAQSIVGRRLVPEHLSGERDPGAPRPFTLADLFEARTEWREESWSYWLHPSASTPDDLEALLDRVQKRLEKPHRHILPPDGRTRGIEPYRHQRGPVTFAMSIYGVENLVFLIVDRPELAARFRDTIREAILTRAQVLDEATGRTGPNEPRGWSWADDDCALLDPDMYRFFGLPIVEALFDRYAPSRHDRRFQHSDSDMGHLLPVLKEANLTACNFGPNLTVKRIRAHLPNTVIHGQLAPFTFSRNETVRMVAETIRDFEYAREERGVVFETAGSVNPGSRLEGLRLIMQTIHEHCLYGGPR